MTDPNNCPRLYDEDCECAREAPYQEGCREDWDHGAFLEDDE